jgi:hypothetical protein
MQVHVTPNHDTSMINSDIVMTDLIMDNDLEVEVFDHLSGDDYADAMMMSILEDLQY